MAGTTSAAVPSISPSTANRLPAQREHAAWPSPFAEPRHREMARALDTWCREALPALPAFEEDDREALDARCRSLVRALGEAGWLRHAVAGVRDGGASDAIDTRSLCVARDTLAWHDGLADFAFAMQGLGSGAISLAGTPAQRERWLPAVARGTALAAFALSEPDAGSDVAAMRCQARPAEGGAVTLHGEKTWISNGGIADFYLVFAREAGADGSASVRGTRDIGAFIVPADSPGLLVAERLEVMAPHPLARLVFDGCTVAATARVGSPGEGFKLAMRTLDIFRTSVAAAALGFGRRALDEALAHAVQRPLMGARLADLPVAQMRLAEMAETQDAAALLTWRAAWMRDTGQPVTQAAAMAKRCLLYTSPSPRD